MEQSLENESQQPKKELSKKDVTRSFWRWTFFSHANYNYERLEQMVRRSQMMPSMGSRLV